MREIALVEQMGLMVGYPFRSGGVTTKQNEPRITYLSRLRPFIAVPPLATPM